MGIIDKIKEWFFGIDLNKVPRILDRVTQSIEKRLAIAEVLLNSIENVIKIIGFNTSNAEKIFSLLLNAQLGYNQAITIAAEPDHKDHFQNRNMFQPGGIILDKKILTGKPCLINPNIIAMKDIKAGDSIKIKINDKT